MNLLIFKFKIPNVNILYNMVGLILINKKLAYMLVFRCRWGITGFFIVSL